MAAEKTYGTTRGLRNHNPVNLRPLSDGQTWDGQCGVDNNPGGPFCEFGDTPEHEADFYGLRAGAKNFESYQVKNGCDTMAKIINRHAPPSENDTTEYVDFVCSKLSVNPYAMVSLRSNLGLFLAFMKFICAEEEGHDPYPDELIMAAIQDALGMIPETPVASQNKGESFQETTETAGSEDGKI